MKNIILILILITIGCSTSPNITKDSVLIDLGKKEVHKRLKSPSSAVHIDSLNKVLPMQDSKNSYRVYINVDADNSFGASLRKKYLLIYELTGKDTINPASYDLKEFFD